MSIKNKTVKSISFILIIMVLVPTVLLSRPQKVDAFSLTGWISDFFAPTTDLNNAVSAANESAQTGFEIKKLAIEVLEEIEKTIARRFLQEMTKSTINWINSGFSGSPLFVENPQSFFGDIAKYEIRTWIDVYGRDPLRFPFGRDTALNVINSYKRQASYNAEYTLSRVINDPLLLERYRNNFNVGGWNGFLINTQYPQNNYIGWNLQASEELARRLEGTSFNAAQETAKTLQQSQGFLTPMTCADNGGNNAYNQTIANQFKRPRFNYSQYERDNEPPNREDYSTARDFDIAQREWSIAFSAEIAEWEESNTCRNLVATTPGSVVANEVMGALDTSRDQSTLAAAMGNSISAIMDALVNKLINTGLSSLTSNRNPRPQTPDTWDYFGNTLGSPGEGGRNITWDSGPDEEILLDEFKKQLSGRTIVSDSSGAVAREEIGDTGNGEYIPGDIANTEEEIRLITNNDPSDPGIFEVMSAIWPKTRELDMCQPGPNYLWEERILEEINKVNTDLNKNSSRGDDDDDTATRANLAIRELQFATRVFKDWIELKMIATLPNSVVYLDAVDEVSDLSQQAKLLTDARRTKSQTLARLKSIESRLNALATQPEPGSNGEEVLIRLRREYNATRSTISNPFTIDSRRNELLVAQDKYFRLQNLTTECGLAREDAGWDTPGGASSRLQIENRTEEELFCSLPIVGGYKHEMFETALDGNTNLPTSSEYQFLPLVNAKEVLTWDKWGWSAFTIFSGGNDDSQDVDISCSIVFNSRVLDYKGDIPGPTNVQARKPAWTTNPGGGTGGSGGSGTGGGSGNQCVGSGNYEGTLESAITTVILQNPDLANSLNTTENSFLFIAAVADKLNTSGFNATDEVLNGNGNPTTGDLVALWQDGDTKMERYDIIASSGAGDRTLAEAAQTDYTGTIPLNCTNSGGGANCACSTGSSGGSGGGTGSGGGGSTFSSLLVDIELERAKYNPDNIDQAQAGLILNAVAWNNRSAGWGLSGKTSGSFCPSSAGSIACDILHHQPTNTLVDVFGAGPDDDNPIAPAEPQWDVIGPPVTENRPWVAPVAP